MESKYESKTFPLNDFNITLSLDHSQLTIKAEHSSTLDAYSLSLNNDTAKHLTNENCEDVDTLYQQPLRVHLKSMMKLFSFIKPASG